MNHNKQPIYSWLGFIFLLLAEFAVFRNYINREIIPFYPKSYDQTVYLLESYKLYENMLFKGRILKYLTQFPLMPQSLLFHVQAALFFLFFGASRFSALMINFIYLAFLQIVSFILFKSLSGKYRYGFIFCGILLTANSLILANDFRIDFIASCLYGILCASIINSKFFLDRRSMWLCLACSILLITMRYVTVCYVLGLMVLLFLYYLCTLFFYSSKGSDPFGVASPSKGSDPFGVASLSKGSDPFERRLFNLILFGVGLLIFIVPILWLNRDIIYNYYIIGHVTGEEKLMRLTVALNITHVRYAFLFYPKVFFASHFTPTTLLQIGSILIIYGLILLFLKYRRIKTAGKLHLNIKDTFVFLILAVLVPTFVLSMDTSKSFLVINIILVPFIYLLVFSYLCVSEKLFILAPALANRLLTLTTIFFLSVGIYSFCMHLSKEHDHQYRDDKDYEVTKMVDTIGDYASSLRWTTMRTTSDFLNDYINAPIGPFYYERHGVLFDVTTLALGNNGMTPISKETALQSLMQSDIFTTNLNDYTPDKIFPFEKSIAPFRHELQQYAKQHMVSLGDFYIFHSWLRIYARPDFLIKGLIDEQIPASGIWLEIPARVANQTRTITLQGTIKTNGKNSNGTASATAFHLDKKISLPTQFHITDNQYQVSLKLPEWQSSKPLIILLIFNVDKMVLQAPTEKHFAMKTPIQS